MSKYTTLKEEVQVENPELNNLRTNIIKKMVQLQIKLPQLAKLIGINYQTLWRITYENYLPNINTLFPIASFFGVAVADLLKHDDLPQYVPILKQSEVKNFIRSNITQYNKDDYETILSSEFVDEKAFAILINNRRFGFPLIFLFKPVDTLYIGNYFLIEVDQTIKFVQTLSSRNKFVNCIDISDSNPLEIPVERIKVIAVAVKQIVNNDLI